jgi:hypothetical protein
MAFPARFAGPAGGRGVHRRLGYPKGRITNRLDYALLLGSKYVSL